jgi:hypothetical protein
MKDFLILSLKTPISRNGGSRFYNRKGLSVKGKKGKVKISGEKGLRGLGPEQKEGRKKGVMEL